MSLACNNANAQSHVQEHTCCSIRPDPEAWVRIASQAQALAHMCASPQAHQDKAPTEGYTCKTKPATKPVKKKRGLAHEVQAPGPNTPQLWLLAVTAGTHTCCLTWVRGHRQALARCVTAEPCTRVTTMRTKQKPCTSIPIKPPPSKASTAQKQLGAAPWEHRAAMHYQTTALKSLSDRPRACNKDALLIYAEKQAAQSKCKQ